MIAAITNAVPRQTKSNNQSEEMGINNLDHVP